MNSTIRLPESTKPRSELALFLTLLRRRIDPDVRVLGSYVRVSQRLGKRVTQEEVAEAIGVTREWLAMLESSPKARASAGLLKRLADALMVTPQERAILFQLAVPGLGRAQLRDESIAVLDGFSRLRSLSKRLWAASSVEDVLTTATEQIIDWFESPVLVHTARRRRESGLWESQPVDDKQGRNNASKMLRELRDDILHTPAAIDAFYLYPRLAHAGDVGTAEFHPLPVRREIRKLFARWRLRQFVCVSARVRSRTGLIGGFSIAHEFGHSYSASDRAVLGTFADFASLALS